MAASISFDLGAFGDLLMQVNVCRPVDDIDEARFCRDDVLQDNKRERQHGGILRPVWPKRKCATQAVASCTFVDFAVSHSTNVCI